MGDGRESVGSVSDTHFRSFVFELLDGSLVDVSALVHQVASRVRFTRIDVTDDDDIDMDLFFAHSNERSRSAVKKMQMADL